MSAPKEFYERALGRVNEILAASAKAGKRPTPPTKSHTGVLFAVARFVLASVATGITAGRVSSNPEWTTVAALTVSCGLVLSVLSYIVFAALYRGTVTGAYILGVMAGGEALLACLCVVLSVEPLRLLDGLGVQAAAMFLFETCFAAASCAMTFIAASRLPDSRWDPAAAELLRDKLQSAVVCYETDRELGEYGMLHRFRERLSEVEESYADA